jgi:hypothetical protein
LVTVWSLLGRGQREDLSTKVVWFVLGTLAALAYDDRQPRPQSGRLAEVPSPPGHEASASETLRELTHPRHGPGEATQT